MAQTKLRITKATKCGGESVIPGDVVLASGAEAVLLIGIGKAVEADEKEKVAKVARPKKKSRAKDARQPLRTRKQGSTVAPPPVNVSEPASDESVDGDD